VTPNLYGNLVANTAAGIAGGTGVMPGGKIGSFLLFLKTKLLNLYLSILLGNLADHAF